MVWLDFSPRTTWRSWCLYSEHQAVDRTEWSIERLLPLPPHPIILNSVYFNAFMYL